MRKLYNFVAFQAAWFAAVLAAAHGREWLGLLAIAVVVAVHLWIARRRRGEWLFLASALPVGFVVDEILHRTGAVVGRGTIGPASFAPVWLLAMWPLFATVFGESMSWMRGRHAVAVVFGVVGAPLSYLGGMRLGALELHAETWRWLLPIAVTWGIAMPILTVAQVRLTTPTPAPRHG